MSVGDVRAFGRVAVLMGGLSPEREISLASGRAALAALRSRGVAAEGVDAGRDLPAVLERGRFDRAFVALHGPWGEDGVVQGALELVGLPYTGSGVLASALAMDKLQSKRLFQWAGLPTPPFRPLGSGDDPAAVLAELGGEVAVKPAAQGSSLGVARAASVEELCRAREAAAAFGPVLAERWVRGREITVGILGGEALPVVEVRPARPFYDWEAKYAEGAGTRYLCPAPLPGALAGRLQALALEAFRLLGCRGWGRVDFLLEGETPWLLEVNTVPGLTEHSLVPRAARAAGMDLPELAWRILAQTLEEGP